MSKSKDMPESAGVESFELILLSTLNLEMKVLGKAVRRHHS